MKHFAMATYALLLAAILASRLPAQMVAPEELLSRDALLFLEVTNAQSFIQKAKSNWYDLWYSEARRSKQLRALDLPVAQVAMTHREPAEHWFSNTVLSICLKENPVASELVALADSFKENGFEFDQVDEDRAVDLLASLFPGKLFWGVESRQKTLEFIFAFEFNPNVFDWSAELIEKSIREISDGEPIKTVDGIEIYFLPNEEIYFFCHQNTIYGTSSTSEDRCVALARQVLNLESNKKTLSTSRHFQLVKAKGNWGKATDSCFFFVRSRDLFDCVIEGRIDESTSIRSNATNSDKTSSIFCYCGWSEYCGGVIEFGNPHSIDYRVVYPLINPPTKEMVAFRLATETELNETDTYRVPERGASIVRAVSTEQSSKWKSLPCLIDPGALTFLSDGSEGYADPSLNEIGAGDWLNELEPVAAVSNVASDGTWETARLLFDSYRVFYNSNSSTRHQADTNRPKGIKLKEYFGDVNSGEHLVAFAYCNESGAKPELSSAFGSLFNFLGRCDSTNRFGVGAHIVKGDFAAGYGYDLRKQAFSRESASIMNLASVISGNFFEPHEFVRSWHSIELPNSKVTRLLLLSVTSDCITCRGCLAE